MMIIIFVGGAIFGAGLTLFAMALCAVAGDADRHNFHPPKIQPPPKPANKGHGDNP